MRPPSPPPVVHYTDHEASSVSEKIKQDESFTKAVQVNIIDFLFLNLFVQRIFKRSFKR